MKRATSKNIKVSDRVYLKDDEDTIYIIGHVVLEPTEADPVPVITLYTDDHLRAISTYTPAEFAAKRFYFYG